MSKGGANVRTRMKEAAVIPQPRNVLTQTTLNFRVHHLMSRRNAGMMTWMGIWGMMTLLVRTMAR